MSSSPKEDQDRALAVTVILAESSSVTYRVYQAYLNAGFSEDQAFTLTCINVQGMVDGHHGSHR